MAKLERYQWNWTRSRLRALAIDGLPSRSVLLNNRVARRKRRQSPLRLVKVVAWEESAVVGEVEDGAVTMGAPSS
jgi:hypothetical protein